MKIISNETGETIANILTNHSMTLDEALDLVPDNYGEESEDE